MAKAFRWAKRHFKTVQEFEAYVASLQRPLWLRGATVHHTWKPTVADWQREGGDHYMDVLERYYRDEVPNPPNPPGWPAGPNLFIGPDGIWQGTPITEQGVHAGPCNSSHLSLEVVGDYDLVEWAEPIKSLALGALGVLVRHQWISIPSINGHRDCLPNKSCPGNAIDMARVRQWVKETNEPRPTDRQVIGVVHQSATRGAFIRSLNRNGGEMLLSEEEMHRVYTLCEWYGIESSYAIAIWVQEGGKPLGSSELQRLTHVPFNLKTSKMSGRRSVSWHGQEWTWAESFQLGWQHGIWHLKNYYGSAGRNSVRQIAELFMREPTTTDAEVDRYVAAVLENMAYIESH